MRGPGPEARAFAALKKILARYAPALDVTVNEPDHYSLDTRHVMDNGKPLFFGAVRISKTYVSFHLMPIYVAPELTAGISPALTKRRQGKSCFNFKAPDPELFDELTRLTRAGYEEYVRRGFIGAPA